jgi:hypothetical protein
MNRLSNKSQLTFSPAGGTKSVEQMLRDLAYVLHVTRKVKAEMLEEMAKINPEKKSEKTVSNSYSPTA